MEICSHTALAAAVAGGRPELAPLHFGQITSLLKCPVVGLCLSLDEQRKSARKGGMRTTGASAFDIHEFLVNLTEGDTSASRAVDGLLRKKFEQKAAPLRRLDLFAFMRRWECALAGNDFAVELWAAATRNDLPLPLQRYIFGGVHMSMHEASAERQKNGEQLRRVRQERNLWAEKMRELKTALSREQKDRRALGRERDALNRQKALLEAENQRLGQQAAAYAHAEHNPALTAELRAHATFLEQSLREAAAGLREAEKQRELAFRERDEQRALTLELQKEVGALLKSSAGCAACADCPNCTGCTDCSGCSDCPRRILMVGGMTRMESLYRQLVESGGDAFEYHDGCLGGVNTLETSLLRADMVLCPVNCNSHRACLLVKSLCKKYKKPVHMMANFSLSAVSRIIERTDQPRVHSA